LLQSNLTVGKSRLHNQNLMKYFDVDRNLNRMD
jgi:hypothetical protein